MKTRNFLFAGILVACFCLLCSVSASAQDNNKKTADTQEVTFLTSLHCENCAKKIQDKLPFEKGVKDIKIEVDAKTVWIQYQPNKTTKEKLQKAIEKIGYTAEEVKPEENK